MIKVCVFAGEAFDENVGRYKTIWELKELRDSVAHGKPIEIETDVKTREELREQMKCPWDKYLTPEYIEIAYKTVKEFQYFLFENCNIAIGQTLTSSVPIRR